ncbi:hypothetical protein T08_11443 [Trichinella sp. T8]|nr:hypothetical protein T08_11443 [Trichinella sp. T8]
MYNKSSNLFLFFKKTKNNRLSFGESVNLLLCSTVSNSFFMVVLHSLTTRAWRLVADFLNTCRTGCV